ncbi:MAG TPA: lipopolysaccharide heptosyltransferase I [Thermoanaerobaculaceae bacterium]|nr:MAG: lipopolysaccharide heptosyltransferase I [Acidobacteria bacterium 37-71-11]HQT94191.1 lipopolysaccharide heptosyltransferase I [Thermoanaerobaculaceae bacterium]HQU33313.1 lipopolysaccharide heptosyltransferase I [Thermoanaerobaculaceae bacterium]
MRIVLTRLSALGDIVHTWPLAAALVAGRETVELAWVVEERFLPLVASHPAVTRAVPVATRRWRRHPGAAATRREVVAARAALRKFSPDLALDPQGLVKSALWAALAGAPDRVGLERAYRRELLAGVCYTRTLAPPPEARHVVDINLSLLAAVGRPAPFGAVPDGRFLLATAAAHRRDSAAKVALLPATGGVGKAWPAESFAELARRAVSAGMAPVVVWGPGERVLAEGIAFAGGQGVALAPATSIPELAVLLSGCAAVVGGDTGPVHLAASLGVPTVAVFVATDPARNGPRGERVRVLAAAGAAAGRGSARAEGAGEVGVATVFEALMESAVATG